MFIYLFRYCRYFKSPHSSTKTGNFTDRPTFKPSLVHKNGQFHGQIHAPNPTCPPNWQFRGQTHVSNPTCPPNWQFRGQTYVPNPTRPPNWQFRGQTHVQTHTRPQKRAIPRTDLCSNQHSSTKRGNFTDRPTFKPTLVHKNGQFRGQTHVQTNTRPQKGAISRTDPCSNPHSSTKLAIPWTDLCSKPYSSTKLAIPWTDPCSKPNLSTKLAVPWTDLCSKPNFSTKLAIPWTSSLQSSGRGLPRPLHDLAMTLKFGEAGYWSDIEG